MFAEGARSSGCEETLAERCERRRCVQIRERRERQASSLPSSRARGDGELLVPVFQRIDSEYLTDGFVEDDQPLHEHAPSRDCASGTSAPALELAGPRDRSRFADDSATRRGAGGDSSFPA